MVFKLLDLYNTKFLYKTYVPDLNAFFGNVIKLQENPEADVFAVSELHENVYKLVRACAKVEFDLANVKLTADTLSCIRTYAKQGIKFIDTVNYIRNEKLQLNTERYAIQEESKTPLPNILDFKSVKEYIGSLDKNTKYTVTTTDYSVVVPLVALIQLSRPSIDVDLSAMDMQFFKYVSGLLSLEFVLSFDRFYFTKKFGTRIVDFSGSGTIDLEDKRGLSKMEAASEGILVPAVLGTTALIHEEGWRDVANECLRVLNNVLNTKKTTLRKFYGYKGVS